MNNIIEKYEIEDCVFESEIYIALNNSFIFKTYILLHKAFKELDSEIFDGIEIDKPLMIYANKHDCETMNIYAFE